MARAPRLPLPELDQIDAQIDAGTDARTDDTTAPTTRRRRRPTHREAGRRGLQKARAALAEAIARNHPPEPDPTDQPVPPGHATAA